MDESHDQQIPPAGAVQHGKIHPPGGQNIGHQYRNRRQKLQKGPLDACHTFDKLIQQDDGGIKSRSAQSEEDSLQMTAAAQIPDAGDQHDAQGGHGEADPLLRPG